MERAHIHMRSWFPWICFPSWLVDQTGLVSFPIKISSLCFTLQKFHLWGPTPPFAWFALPAAGRDAPFPVHPISSWGTENRLQGREPSWSWHRESSSSSLVSVVRASHSWVKEKQAVVGLADSKQGRLCPWSMLHWHFALEGFNYFLLSVGILSRVLPVRSFPHVCSFLVSEKMELLEIVSRLVWSNIGVATGFMHILSWQGRKFHITEVPMTESKTIAEHSNLAWVALPSYLQVSD